MVFSNRFHVFLQFFFRQKSIDKISCGRGFYLFGQQNGVSESAVRTGNVFISAMYTHAKLRTIHKPIFHWILLLVLGSAYAIDHLG